MKQFFRFSILLLALLLPALATAHDFEVDGIYYNINGNEATVTNGGSYSNRYSGSVAIPATVTYNGTTYSVTSIGESAFSWCMGLTSIDIPNSVTSIGKCAFEYCMNLPSVVIPNSVTSIGDSAFENCSGLTSINIPNLVTTIGNGAFGGCRCLTSVAIPNSVTSIGDEAFWGCEGLTSIVIPTSVTSIGNEAFRGCSGLTSIIIPNSVTSIGNGAFGGCRCLTSVAIPNSVTEIGESTFENCEGLTSVAIPSSVTSIGNNAFTWCSSLTSIVIPNSVTEIGDEAFSWCSGLTSIVVASENPRYDSRNNCNAIIETASNTLIVGCKNTIIPNSVTKIGDYAFFGCTGLTSIDIPNSVTSIGNEAFAYSGLTSINIPNSVTSIGGEAFYATDWYYNQPDGLVYAGMVAYKYKGMMPNGTSITLKEGTLGIAGYAFVGCTGLTSIDIPNSVISIGETAFYQCTGLTSIVIPNSVTSIGYGVFSRCTGLASIVVASGNPRYDSRNNCNAIIETASNALISGCCNTIIPNSVTSIGNKAFYGCDGLTSIVIPNLVTSIGESAFEYCSGLTDVYCYIADLSRVSSGDKQFSLGYGDCSGRTLHVLQGTADAYRADENWYPYFGQIVDDLKSDVYGDVNGDGEVNIADINATIDTILGGSVNAAADVNGDGEINIADVNDIINIILNLVVEEEHEWVDLGLPSGTLWATCNVGASNPEELGSYFAWGETATKDFYDWSTYKWCNNNYMKMTKYCTLSNYGNDGFVDNKTELDHEDDAAYVNWGPSWRIPSYEQFEELCTSCTSLWTQHNGVNGLMFTGPNGNNLFLPATGMFWGKGLGGVGADGYYWSRTLYNYPNDALILIFKSNVLSYWDCSYRSIGLTVRAVRASN